MNGEVEEVTQRALKHEDEYGMYEDTNLILSQAVCVHLSRKTVKGQPH